MKLYRRVAPLLLAGLFLLPLSGCLIRRHTVSFDDSGFESRRTRYFPGERVTVYYGMIATDTDYTFWADGVDMRQSYDERHGYVFTFTMPDHDVTLHAQWHNSMTYVPTVSVCVVDECAEADLWILPQTEENLHTTLWGPATVHLAEGEQADLVLQGAYDGDPFLIRIIDGDSGYYAANDVILHEGDRIVFRSGSDGTRYDARIEILDGDGAVVSSYEEIFTGVL